MSHIEEGTLHAYLDGESPAHEREAIEAHLAVCEECRTRLQEARTVASDASEILGHLEPRPTRRPPWQELEERASARGRLARKRRWLNPGLGWAASIILAFGLGWLARTSYLSELELSPAEVAREEAPADISEIPATGRVEDRAGDVSEHRAVSPALRFEEMKTAALEQEPEAADPSARDRRTAARQARSPEQDEAVAADLEDGAAEKRAAAAAKSEAMEQRRATESPGDTRGDREKEAAATTAPATEERARSQTAEADEPEPESSVDWTDVITRDLQRIAGERREAHPARPVALSDSPRAPDGTRGATHTEGPPDALSPAAGGGVVASDAFFRLAPAEAVRWLGAPLRTLPELELQSAEVGPGTAVAQGVTGRPAVRLVYRDAAGTEIALIQQLAWSVQESDRTEPTLVVLPTGRRAYRWLDERGYWLTISGDLSADSLRALADRVR